MWCCAAFTVLLTSELAQATAKPVKYSPFSSQAWVHPPSPRSPEAADAGSLLGQRRERALRPAASRPAGHHRAQTRTSALPEGSRRSQAASKQTPAALGSPKPGPPRGPKPGGQPRRCPAPPGSVEPVPGPGPCRPLSPRRPGAESRPVPCRRCRGREGRKGVGGKRQRRRCRGSSPPAPT